MAATRLITMHQNKGKSVAKSLSDRTDCAKNGEKTENGQFISSYACQAESVDEEFMLSKREYERLTGRHPKGNIIAYQIRQSFKPGEITPEEANQVGYETAMRFTKGNHAFIVATHTDKAHIHNHIIFNSTSLDCTHKFRDFFFVGLALQRLSDIICLEHGLSVIEKKKPSERVKRTTYPEKKSLICNYPNKDRTIIAYFLSSILNHIGKNKDKCTIFKNDVKGSTVFSFLDLTFYAYSFFPNYGNTQKLLQIISYVRDEYDIFEESTRLQALINKYAFIFDKANINDVVNLFLFCRQAKIEIPYLQEECIVRKIKEKDDPILWATYLMYSQYNRKYSDEIRSCIEKTLLEKINAIRVQKSVYEYREFWWILIFNKCPFITNASQNAIDNAITLLNVPTDSGCTHTLVDIFKNYLQNSPIQFFDWDIERNDFLRTLTFKTHEKSIFKNYKENAISLAWGSI